MTGATEFYMASMATMGDLPFGERANIGAGRSVAVLCQTGSGQCSVTQLGTNTTTKVTIATPD